MEVQQVGWNMTKHGGFLSTLVVWKLERDGTFYQIGMSTDASGLGMCRSHAYSARELPIV